MDPRTKEEIEEIFDRSVDNEIHELRHPEVYDQDDIPLEPLTDWEMADFEQDYRSRHPEE